MTKGTYHWGMCFGGSHQILSMEDWTEIVLFAQWRSNGFATRNDGTKTSYGDFNYTSQLQLESVSTVFGAKDISKSVGGFLK